MHNSHLEYGDRTDTGSYPRKKVLWPRKNLEVLFLLSSLGACDAGGLFKKLDTILNYQPVSSYLYMQRKTLKS